MLYTESLVETIRQQLQERLACWSLPEGSQVELLTVSENITYRAVSPGGEPLLVLRLHRPDYHTRAEIESELCWIEGLRASQAVHTPAVVPGESGTLLEIAVQGQPFWVVAFEYAPGQEPDVGESLPGWFEKLGRVTATLHQHSREWIRPEGFVRKEWNLHTMLSSEAHWGDWREAEGLDRQGEHLIARAIDSIHLRIAGYGQGAERFGLVHADLRLANLLVSGERLTVIDFDDCGISWFGYDFATAISFVELDRSIPALQQAWMKGYRSCAPFSDEDEAMLDTFVMIRRIMLTAWLAKHSESDTYRLYGDGYTAGTVELAQRYLNAEQERGDV
ncbi:Aminoglycoside phosphotransferase [Marinobacterium lacunae]|uniref:Aminoglycoside phosphotransferase n=1 Tax=Marinobacterium lacunae TaxID=1232683 RepID=A0A081G073_9GAMM|nr:phosphotransferase [Marinobacterium lacunae]KEA64178.1 Aminoglycoside phosphotransferase [Marinobacterium lacunae]MBR9885054.1 phosphotransferase [Oceanospirillales bacterium]